MRQRLAGWLSLVTVCCMLSVYCTTARAALLDVGPTIPQVIGSSMPTIGHGFPAWYRDQNRVPLEPCFSPTALPSGPACVLLADPGYNPLNPLVFPTNFPGEAFYFVADALLTVPAGKIRYRAGLEAAFSTGLATPGGQITFARIRVTADLPVAGTYRFTHPYGVETLVADTAGKRAITFTRDVGVGSFTGAVSGDLGPWLVMTGFPLTVGAETFIGDPNIAAAVTGSPFNTNFFRVDGPVGSNLDGLGHNFIQTDLFAVAGKMTTVPLGTPLVVDSATYIRDAVNTQVEVTATTQPVANVTTGLPPNPLALLGVPAALQVVDVSATIPTTTMLTNSPADGKFFASASLATPPTLPATVRVTNIADIPPTSVDVPLVDEVVINEASYSVASQTLNVAASSGDRLAAPALTVSMRDGQVDVPLGTIAGGHGKLSVSFPFTHVFPPPVGIKSYNIPPENVTVTSAKLGSDTELVTSQLNQSPVAVNDTATVVPNGSVTINVAANDTDPDTGDSVVPATVTLAGAPPAKGTAVKNSDGTITYNQNVAFGGGTDTFYYTIEDTFGAVSNIAAVTVIIDSPPVANAFAALTDEDTVAVIPVSSHAVASVTGNPANAIAPATLQVTTAPLHGAAAAIADGTVRYTPNLNYNGADSFQYTVRDTLGSISNAATVSINVNLVADPPLAINDFATTLQNAPVTINVLANDSHPDGLPSAIVPSTLTIVTNPSGGTGTAQVSNGQVLFTPAVNFSGSASFTYLVRDNVTTTDALGTASTPATVTVTVTPVNIPPTANNDTASTFANTARIINVVANDTDTDGAINRASVVIASSPANGTAVANLDGTVTFTPSTGFVGTDTFTYNVKDNTGAVSNIAQVTVSIASPVIDSVTVLQAQFTQSKNDWLVQGTTTNAPLGTVVSIYAGSDLTGQQIGTFPVDAAGRWKFQSATTGVALPATRTISVKLPSGASRLAFPVTVK